jgi:hypothetical protein
VQEQYDGTSGRMTATQAFGQALYPGGIYNTVKSQHSFFANGVQVGSFGQLTQNGQFAANFDVNYTPVSDSYPAMVPSEVVVQTGETLRSIAARVFGDANLWYVIAEETVCRIRMRSSKRVRCCASQTMLCRSVTARAASSRSTCRKRSAIHHRRSPRRRHRRPRRAAA